MNPVIFVGAGPGDPELITLKAIKVLSDATVVLTDYLVHPDILLHAPQATMISVGKSRGYHSKQQSDINQLLIDLAHAGERVVRLKGGDPGVFGRLGEELMHLVAHQIPFEIIPGVSSAFSVPLYAGIPLTYRSVSRSMAFVTATTIAEDTASLSIPQADTVVLLMPLTVIHELSLRLQELGFDPNTPVAVISNGSTNAQRVHRGTIATIPTILDHDPLPSPAMMVVGQVVQYSDELSWFTPLGGDSPFVRMGGHSTNSLK